MPAEGNLAELYVQFSAKGADEVVKVSKELKEAMKDLLEELQEMKKEEEDLAKEEEKAAKQRTKDIKDFQELAKGAFAVASASIMGFVTAGMAGTAQGQMLTFQLGELSRTIAGIFGPEIQATIEIIRDLTNWLRSLSDAQLESIAFWGKMVVGMGLLLTIVPRVVSAFQTIRAAAIAMGLANLFAQAAAQNWAGVAAATAVGVAAGITGLAIASSGGDDDKKKGSRRSLAQSVSGFESVEASYNRVAASALTSSLSIPEQQLDEMKIQTEELRKLNGETKSKPPVVDNRR